MKKILILALMAAALIFTSCGGVKLTDLTEADIAGNYYCEDEGLVIKLINDADDPGEVGSYVDSVYTSGAELREWSYDADTATVYIDRSGTDKYYLLSAEEEGLYVLTDNDEDFGYAFAINSTIDFTEPEPEGVQLGFTDSYGTWVSSTHYIIIESGNSSIGDIDSTQSWVNETHSVTYSITGNNLEVSSGMTTYYTLVPQGDENDVFTNIFIDEDTNETFTKAADNVFDGYLVGDCKLPSWLAGTTWNANNQDGVQTWTFAANGNAINYDSTVTGQMDMEYSEDHNENFFVRTETTSTATYYKMVYDYSAGTNAYPYDLEFTLGDDGRLNDGDLNYTQEN